MLIRTPCFLCPTVLQSSHKVFSLHKLLAEKGIMTSSLSQNVQYMDFCQNSRPLFLMVSNDLEDRRYFDNVGVILLYKYTLIFNLLFIDIKFNVLKTDSNERSKLVEIKCVYGRRNTTVFSNCWRNQLRVSALLGVGHHHVDSRISEESYTLQCAHPEWGNYISFYNIWGGA
jgi:hypothetical protein